MTVPKSVQLHAWSWPPHSVSARAAAEVKSQSGWKMFKPILHFLLPFISLQDTGWNAHPPQEEPEAGLFLSTTQCRTMCHWAAPRCFVSMEVVVSRYQGNLPQTWLLLSRHSLKESLGFQASLAKSGADVV